MTKQEARRKAKAAVAAMSDAEKEWASGAIVDALTSLDAVRKCKRPFVFLSAEDEPDTHELIGLLLALEKTVSVPRTVGDEMEAVVITPYTDFRKNKWGIEEPVRGHAATDIDLAVVPLVAFDDDGNRLGYGGGNYDRALPFASSDAVIIGIAFAEQRVPTVPALPHDIRIPIISA